MMHEKNPLDLALSLPRPLFLFMTPQRPLEMFVGGVVVAGLKIPRATITLFKMVTAFFE